MIPAETRRVLLVAHTARDEAREIAHALVRGLHEHGIVVRLLADEGDDLTMAAAEALAREAVALADETDFTVLRGDAFMDLADVLRTAGRETESRAFAEQALELYEQKGNVVAAGRARRILDA